MDDELQELPIGKAEVISEGKDVALLAFGTMVHVAQLTAERLKEQGISARVINARFAKPLDEELLKQLYEEQIPVVTIEEGTVVGGFGSAVLEFYNHNGYQDVKIKVIGIPDVYIEHASIAEQLEEVGLTPEQIATKVQAWLTNKEPIPN